MKASQDNGINILQSGSVTYPERFVKRWIHFFGLPRACKIIFACTCTVHKNPSLPTEYNAVK